MPWTLTWRRTPSARICGWCRWPAARQDRSLTPRDAARAADKAKGTLYQRLFFRHWSTYSHFKRSHLFVVATDAAAGTAPRDITPGDHDVPPFSPGGQDFFAISPDGKEVAFTSDIAEFEPTSTNNEIFTV